MNPVVGFLYRKTSIWIKIENVKIHFLNENRAFSTVCRSDIQYSIDDDTESLHKDADPESRTPIIKPSSRQLSNNSDLKGSENSLLNMTDEDLWLRKGMDEDGSFRQVYIKE